MCNILPWNGRKYLTLPLWCLDLSSTLKPTHLCTASSTICRFVYTQREIQKCVSLMCLKYVFILYHIIQIVWIHVRFQKKWKMAQNEMLQNKIIPYNHLLSFRQILFSSLTQNIVITFIALLFEARACSYSMMIMMIWMCLEK